LFQDKKKNQNWFQLIVFDGLAKINVKPSLKKNP
jgi:hypothetical protein